MASFGLGTSLGKVGVRVGGACFPNVNGSKPVTKHPVCSVSRKGNKYPFLATGSMGTSCSLSRCSNSKISVMASLMETEKLGIKIVKNPPESKLSELGVRSWPKTQLPSWMGINHGGTTENQMVPFRSLYHKIALSVLFPIRITLGALLEQHGRPIHINLCSSSTQVLAPVRNADPERLLHNLLA